MARNVVAPLFWISAMIGRTFAAWGNILSTEVTKGETPKPPGSALANRFSWRLDGACPDPSRGSFANLLASEEHVHHPCNNPGITAHGAGHGPAPQRLGVSRRIRTESRHASAPKAGRRVDANREQADTLRSGESRPIWCTELSKPQKHETRLVRRAGVPAKPGNIDRCGNRDTPRKSYPTQEPFLAAAELCLKSCAPLGGT
jgi:hypothetical protein